MASNVKSDAPTMPSMPRWTQNLFFIASPYFSSHLPNRHGSFEPRITDAFQNALDPVATRSAERHGPIRLPQHQRLSWVAVEAAGCSLVQRRHCYVVERARPP